MTRPRATRIAFASLGAAAALAIGCQGILGIENGRLRAQSDGGATSCTLNSDCAQGDVCIFAMCSVPCEQDRDCATGSFCLRTGSGLACVSSAQPTCGAATCPAGSTCADGVCRNSCDGSDGSTGCRTDQTCAPSGFCVGTSAGHDPGATDAGSSGGATGSGGSSGAGGSGGQSGAGGSCSGTSCKKMGGEQCTARSECLSNFCKDGYCCESGCSGTCQSCAVSGSEGACSTVLAAADPDTCTGIYTCGSSGACKLADNQQCTTASDCANNACNPYHPDQDGDGFGDATTVNLCAAKAPTGYVTNGSDCCDRDKTALPGATAFYQVANACGSFDYNCDGVTTKSYSPYTQPQCNSTCSTWYCFDPAAPCGSPVNLLGQMSGACWIANPNYSHVSCR